jgi:hypothetical protein
MYKQLVNHSKVLQATRDVGIALRHIHPSICKTLNAHNSSLAFQTVDYII